jgi:copper chaperone
MIHLSHLQPGFHMRRATVQITGMSCGHCLHAVNEALSSQPGIQVESLRMGRADVRYDEQAIDAAGIESLIAEAGYTATVAPSPETDGAEERV